MPNLSYENEFDLHENEPVGGTHFNINGLARKLVLTQRQKPTRKWPFLWLASPSSITALKTDKILIYASFQVQISAVKRSSFNQ